MYPEELVMPMKAELTDKGFQDLTTPEEVANAIKKEGTTLLMINSVCGCAAGAARPGVIFSLTGDKKPDQLTTEFKPETKAESSTGAVIEKILSIKELSRMKIGDERTIRRWIEKGEIKGFKLGKKWFVTEPELNLYLEKSKAKTKKTEI